MLEEGVKNGKSSLALGRLVPVDVHLCRERPVTAPAIYTQIEVTGVDDGQGSVERGEDGRGFAVKLGQQGSARSR